MMNKYEKGDKFIIEIDKVITDGTFKIYKIRNTNTLYLFDSQLDKLERIKKNSENENDLVK